MACNKVYVIDDDIHVRDALSLYLSQQGYSVHTYTSVEDLLSIDNATLEGCAIIDLYLEGMNGLQALEVIRERGLNLASIVITAHGDVTSVRQAFLSSAVDFIEKPYDPEVLSLAVKDALRRVDERQPSVDAERDALLTPREQEVKACLLEGRSNKEITDLLQISVRTVEVHRARVLEKLGFRSVVDLVRASFRSGQG